MADFPNPLPAPISAVMLVERKLALKPRLSFCDNRNRFENRSMRTVSPLHARQQAAQANYVRTVHCKSLKCFHVQRS